MPFETHQIRAGMENTFYLAGDPVRKAGVLIDPFDGESAVAAVERIGWRLQAVVNTHGHWDHVGGNDAVTEKYGVPIFAHPLEDVPGSRPIGDQVTIGSSRFDVLHTPGHRPGHVCLLGEKSLFTGDVLFVAGCGNPKFGGDLDQLYESVQHLSALSDDLWVYPGHNYAEKNLAFTEKFEPDNPAIAEAREWFHKVEAAGQVHRSTLGDEKRWNLFFRLESPSLRDRLVQEGVIGVEDTERGVFKALRELRNNF